MHKPIQLIDIELSFRHKTCFEAFSVHITYGSRIAIIGRNGSGKSSLLKMLAGLAQPSSGVIRCEPAVEVGYVPQLIEEYSSHSGAERFQLALSHALALDPKLLLLDEPTNHLDKNHRNSLMRMLTHYQGTVIAVTHDAALLEQCFDTLWHIDQQQIRVFNGSYRDYRRQLTLQRQTIQAEIDQINREAKAMHEKLMQEQQRAASSRKKGEKSIKQRKWPTITSQAKARRGEETAGRKQVAIVTRRTQLQETLADLQLPEEIIPTFSLTAQALGQRLMLQIFQGSVGYAADKPVLANVSLRLVGSQRLAILGANGSGKSSLLKAIVNDPSVFKTGEWLSVSQQEIGYLDQHYRNLSANSTVLATISTCMPHWTDSEVRRHLATFLFREQAAVHAGVNQLSGGERARLSLAQLAAKTPSLLILDEITNNLDLETKQHVTEVLRHFPGAMIIVSHDSDFLQQIGIDVTVSVENFAVR